MIKQIIRKLFIETSDDKLRKLSEGGAKVGKKIIIYDPKSVVIDNSRPWLLSIGSYTKITHGVIILTHDYSLSVLRRVYGEWIGEGAETVIGENCFIGINSVLLMGTQLGNNVIVGAGSVVHGKFPDNVVIAGNPAKIICTLEEHYNNRKKKTTHEAIMCAKKYYERFGKWPKPSEMNGFKFLFTPREKGVVNEYGIKFECNGDETDEVIEQFYNSKPVWENYDAFLKSVKEKEED